MPHLTPDKRPKPSPDPILSPEVVVSALGPVMKSARRRRIDRVVRHRLASVTVVLENLRDPHNGAAVLRSCEAMGLAHVHVVEERQKFSASPKVSQRSDKWINVYHHPTAEACITRLHDWGFRCFVATPPALHSNPGDAAWPAVDRPIALVFGNEHLGLSDRARELSDGRFSIPMRGFMESLNLSVTVAITLAEMTRRRREHLGSPGDLGPEQAERLRAGYYVRSVKHAPDVVMHQLRRLKKI